MDELTLAPRGGRAAAGGFRYQYLRTFEVLLAQLSSPMAQDWEVWVDEPGADAVDYRVVAEGRTLTVCQVKSSYDPARGRPLGASESYQMLVELCAAGEADRYVLQSNRRLTSATERLAEQLIEGTAGRPNSAVAAEIGLDPEILADRFRRARIETDRRGCEQIVADLSQVIAKIRRSRHSGAGPHSSEVLLNHCVAQIFRSAAGPSWTISRAEFSAMLNLDDATLALATGDVDWGVVVAELLPPMPTVERTVDEKDLREALAGGICRRAVNTVVLSGLSGIGKSSLAARHAHIHAAAYDLVLWLNAESHLTLTESVRRALPPKKAPREIDDDQVARLLHDWLGETPLTWLLVFDNAPGISSVYEWLPSLGSGHCIITTVDSTGAATFKRLAVGRMSAREGQSLVESRLGLQSSELNETDEWAVALVADEAERWPLAIELTTAFLVDSGRGLSVAPELLARLRREVLDDEAYVPPGYPRTLLAAIHLAWQRIAELPNGHSALALIGRASLLDGEDIPTVIVGSPGTINGELPGQYPEASELLDLDRAVMALRRFSLVERTTRRRVAHPVLEDTLSLNAIVAEVVRSRLERDRDLLRVTAAELFHSLSSWVGHWSSSHQFAALDAVRSHVETVLSWSGAYRLVSLELLTMMGNIAGLYQWLGRHRDAVGLYERERELLRAVAAAEPALSFPQLLFQTDSGLVANMVRTGSTLKDLLEVAEEAFELVVSGEVVADDERSRTAAGNLIGALTLYNDTSDTPAVQHLLNHARAIFPSAVADLNDPSGPQRVEELLRSGQYDAAAELAADIESRPSFLSRGDPSFVLSNRAQAEFARGRIEAGMAALERLKTFEEFAPGRVNRRVVLTAIDLAGGLTRRVLSSEPWPLPVESLVSIIDRSDLSDMTDYERWQVSILRAWAEHRAGRSERASALIAETDFVPTRDRLDGQPLGWQLLRSWLAARQYLEARQPSHQLRLVGFQQDDAGTRQLILRLEQTSWTNLQPRLATVTMGFWTTFGATAVLDLRAGPSWDWIATLELDLANLSEVWKVELPPFVAQYTVPEGYLITTGLWLGPDDSDLHAVALPYGYRGLGLDFFTLSTNP